MIGASDVVAFVSTAIALVSLLFNWLVVKRQSQMQLEGLRLQSDAALFAWGKECIEALSRLIDYVEHPQDEEAERMRRELRWKLSALVDQGRMFFPNYATTAYVSTQNPRKNPGWRPAILDAVAFAYFIVRDEERLGPRRGDRAAFLRDCRRLFYTEIQRATDPRARARILGRLLSDGDPRTENDLDKHLAKELDAMLPGVLERFAKTADGGASPPA
ncbi:MAG: hypothetical protein AB7M12_13090 [Hyphomonadaceae bacterium]